MKKIFITLLFFLFCSTVQAAEETIRIYPTDDGLTQLYDDDNITNWSEARNYTGLVYRDPKDDNDQLATRADKQSGKYRIYRMSMLFDTSIIPSDSTITSSSFYGYRGYSNNHGESMVLTEHSRASTTNLSKQDWNLSKYGNEIARESLLEGQYTEFTFNNLGIEYINKNGFTIIGVMQDNDYDDIDIGSKQSGASIYSSEAPGSSTDPYLEITYTIQDEDDESEEDIEKLSGELETIIEDSINKKSIKNSYLANVKKIKDFFNEVNPKAALNQVLALLKKTEKDNDKSKLDFETYEEINALSDEILEVIEESEPDNEVTLMTQISSPYPPKSEGWADDIYGDGTPDWCGNTIAGCGCAITSLSMIGKYHGVDKGFDGSDVNPGNMNAWLKENNGYTEINTIRWFYGLQYLSDEEGYSYLGLDKHNTSDFDLVDSYINDGNPAIAFKTSKGHYFVLDEVLPDGLYGVKDPFWYETETTDDAKDVANNIQGYGGGVDQVNLYSYHKNKKPLPKWVEIQLGSPAELLITDSQGRRAGYDPETGEVLLEIPGSSYSQAEGVVTNDNLPAEAHLSKVLLVNEPDDNLYSLEVIGTGTGDYDLSIDVGGGYGFSEIEHIASSTSEGLVDSFIVDVPELGSSSRAVERLRELANLKEQNKPELANKLRSIATRLETKNYSPLDGVIENIF